MKKALYFLFFATFLIVGCVSNNFIYTPPNTYKMQTNSAIINKSKDQVWKQLITGLGKEFFVINNMDKDSGFINISYSGDPERYIDGGELYFMVENLAGKREYRFPASKKYARFETVINNSLLVLERKLSLEGRMNIIIAELEPSKSSVTVNTRYILTQTTAGRNVLGEYMPQNVQTISFNTGGSATNQGGTIYRANGKFEEKVLSIIMDSN